MNTSLISTVLLTVCFASLASAGTKSELYYRGVLGQDSAVELAHPQKGETTLPVGAANIRAIAVTGDFLVGATIPEHKQKSPVLFRFNLKTLKLADYITFALFKETGTVPSHQIAMGSTGTLYVGTYGEGKTGNLIKITVSGKQIEAIPLGPIKDSTGIFSLAASADGKTLYGILYPSNAFFTYDIAAQKAAVFDSTAFNRKTKGKIREIHTDKEAPFCKALGLDKKGRVYGSMGMGMLFRFDPAQNKIEKLGLQLPYEQYRVHTNRVESWLLAPDGALYGGTSVDGYLFKLDPEKLTLTNLGKPVAAGNLKSMVFINQRIYGLCGEQPMYLHLFTYNIPTGGFDDLGILYTSNPKIRDRERAYTASMMLNMGNGNVIVAEDDLMPSLLFYKFE